ncbi:DNA-binding response regulator [Paenibacillus marchantiophytorum]|uniref:Heme response regulator HssR n=1 Tax=Paenibacillus marchantiophytorum TaxID=1619310 RepID=A0ABQ1EME6_9BACL|nr:MULTISPECIES: response regulator transcription factor [Paenibacillus]UKS26839.1 response regulator transcription factor [Paenibacillus sp. HWE-109]GFZ78308.1 DNA-binding response regulator [Paenibacillus marchantiophytorum]
MKTHILVVDDDAHIRELLRFLFSKEGYTVFEASDGVQASAILEVEQVHLAVVDVMMPLKDGLDLCSDIRSTYDIPVMLLTAKGELEDKEKGFQSGTDDYMVKPFEPKELLFRARALLRRYQLVSSEIISLNRTIINRKSYEVTVGDETLLLPLKEFQLLAQLASHPGRIFTREQLIQMLWGTDYEGDNRTIDVHIKRLRERFYDISHDFVITTVRGLGYKLEVTEG